MKIENAKLVRFVDASEIKSVKDNPAYKGRVFVDIEGSYPDALTGFDRTFRKLFLLVPDVYLAPFIKQEVIVELQKSKTGISCCLSIALKNPPVAELEGTQEPQAELADLVSAL